MTSAHAQCPFLLINSGGPKRDWLAEARAGWRTVSPARPALTAAQLGAYVELGLAAARWTIAFVRHLAVHAAQRSVALMQLAVQTWRSVRPEAQPVAVAAAAQEPVVVVAPEPAVVIAPEPVAVVASEPAPQLEPAIDGATALDWFWRAKNADTLDELIECLERACKLEPENEMLSANLALAMERRAVKAVPRATPKPVVHGPLQRRPSLAARTLRQVTAVVRLAAALAALGVAAALLLSALPAQLRAAAGISELPLPALADVFASVHLPLAGGYDAASALPYAIGFMALFAGVGLLQPQTRP